MRALFDTNILIDYLNGVEKARKELASYDEAYVSLISWIEVLVGAKDKEEENLIRSFFGKFSILPLTNAVAEKTVIIRKKERLSVPDAIIWATAQVEGMLLVTRNTDDFPEKAPGIHVPYKL